MYYDRAGNNFEKQKEDYAGKIKDAIEKDGSRKPYRLDQTQRAANRQLSGRMRNTTSCRRLWAYQQEPAYPVG
ncbi:hypothetical protein NXW13_00840 [Bacteroides thetaiotaomicron]|nr:hypothetical protein [Bacteroides thetaiotaomicron]